jgi:hypothetical protein
MSLRGKPGFLAGLVILLILLIYLPALNIYLFGDGYALLDYCYSGWRHPLIFFDLINNFFRPIINFSYLFNYSVFHEHISLYILTTLCIHLLNVFFLYRLLMKVTGRRSIAVLTMLLYGTSSLYSGATIELGFAATPDITLLCFSLGILLCFSKTTHVWGIGNQFVLYLCLLGAIGSKEAWIILPLIVFSFLILVMKYSLKKAIVAIVPMSALVGIYVGILFLIPWVSRTSSALDYSGFSLANIQAMLVKASYVFWGSIGFFGDVSLQDYSAGHFAYIVMAYMVGISCLVGLVFLKKRLALWGMSLMILAHIPTLPIPYAPSRFNYIPLVGFWIMMVAVVDQIVQMLGQKLQIKQMYLTVIIGLGIGCLVLYHVIMLQWEINDYRRLGMGCKTIVNMYKAIKVQIRLDQQVIFINQGTRRVVTELAQSIQGYQKVLFVRSHDIWELIHFAHLANFVGEPFTYRLVPVQEEKIEAIWQNPFQVVIFTDQGFLMTHTQDDALRQFYQTYHQLPAQVEAYQFLAVN